MNEANVEAEKAAPPPKNSTAWDALMLDLCAERASIDAEAEGYRALIKKRRTALKSSVTGANSTMGAFDYLYDLFCIRAAAEESGDDSVLLQRQADHAAAWRVMELGTQASFDDDGFATAAQDAQQLADAARAGAKAGTEGMKLVVAFAAWPGTHSKRERKAFEDAWSDAAAKSPHAPTEAELAETADKAAAARVAEHGDPAPKQRGRPKGSKNAAKPAVEVAPPEPAPEIQPTTTGGAYAFGELGRQHGDDLETTLARASTAPDEIRKMIEAGWNDANEAIRAAIDDEPVPADPVEELPDDVYEPEDASPLNYAQDRH